MKKNSSRSTSIAPLPALALICSIYPNYAFSEEYLSAEEVRELVVGNTLSGYWDGAKYYEYYASDGTLKGIIQGEKYDGTYEIRDDGCLYADYEGVDDDGCFYTLSVENSKLTVRDPRGEKAEETLHVGNPKSL